MARNREKKGSLNFQLKKLLDSKLAIGESKFEDKKQNLTFDKIYSWSTYRAYLQHGTYFLTWAKEKYGCTDLVAAKEYVNEWLKTREEQGLSAYTVKLETSAMMKIYNIDKDSIYKSKARLRANIERSRGEKVRDKQLSAYTVKLETSAMMKIYNIDKDSIYKSKARLRANIERSRGEKVRDKHFSEKNNQELVRFCRATGLRRAELSQIRGTDLIFINDNPYLKVTRNTKGGRERVVPIILDQQFVVDLLKTKGAEKVFEKIPNSADIHGYRAEFATTLYKKLEKDIKDQQFVVDLLKTKGAEKVFEKIPNSADIHGYRAEFATTLYKKLEKDINTLPKEKKYYCRKDLKGIVYDKDAMLEVSRALGHNRIDVIAGHYIRKD